MSSDHGPLYELAAIAPALEFRAVHEVVVDALPFLAARRPGGERHGEVDGPVLLQEALAERGLARAGGRGDHEHRTPHDTHPSAGFPVGGTCHAALPLTSLLKRPFPPDRSPSFEVLHLFAYLLHLGLDHDRLLADRQRLRF